VQETIRIHIATSALVIHPYLKGAKESRSYEAKLAEAARLAEALYLRVVEEMIVPLREIRPATYLGKGKTEEIRGLASERNIELVVMNCKLSPVQQRNLEKAWNAKVIDRTALIIEIFGSRARTREGKLQVELASLEYQKSRLVRTWTHLERQRGGFGFLAGPGESQLEVDRRLLGDRIIKLKRELESARKTRGLHRKSRKSVPYPVIALVGYTNAGKSTLFNRLTKAKVTAEDKLFATLDPTMRIINLPSKRKAILSDTVGFISDLPTELVAAFRATLEEVIEADIILHVRDISSGETMAEKRDVLEVMKALGIQNKPVIEVLNKADLLGPNLNPLPEGEGMYGTSLPSPSGRGQGEGLVISALTGKGCAALLKTIDKNLGSDDKPLKLKIPADQGKLIAWIYEHGEDVKAKPDGNFLRFSFKMSAKNLAHLKRNLGI